MYQWWKIQTMLLLLLIFNWFRFKFQSFFFFLTRFIPSKKQFCDRFFGFTMKCLAKMIHWLAFHYSFFLGMHQFSIPIMRDWLKLDNSKVSHLFQSSFLFSLVLARTVSVFHFWAFQGFNLFRFCMIFWIKYLKYFIFNQYAPIDIVYASSCIKTRTLWKYLIFHNCQFFFHLGISAAC